MTKGKTNSMSVLSAPIELFYSYADADEDLWRELDKHLSQLKREDLITNFHKRQITAGTDWKKVLDQHLNTASVILLFISADYPPIGAGSISVIADSASNYVIAGAVSFYNIDQNVPFGEIKTTMGDGTSSTLSVPSNTSQLVFDFYGNQATPPGYAPMPKSDQIQQMNIGDFRSQEIASSTKAGASLNTTMTWNWKKTNNYADIGVPINSN